MDGVDIPPELSTTDKLADTMTSVGGDLSRVIDNVFSELGYGDISKSTKVALSISIFALPILIIVACVCIYGGSDDDEVTDKRPVQRKNSKTKKKKLE